MQIARLDADTVGRTAQARQRTRQRQRDGRALQTRRPKRQGGRFSEADRFPQNQESCRRHRRLGAAYRSEDAAILRSFATENTEITENEINALCSLRLRG